MQDDERNLTGVLDEFGFASNPKKRRPKRSRRLPNFPELASETRLTFTEAAYGDGVDYTTLWRAAANGVDGIKLQTFMHSNRRCTTVEALERFHNAVNSRKKG